MNIEHAASPCHPYPRYRPSSVEWLGDVPAHWEVRRIKTLFRESDERKFRPQANGTIFPDP